MVCPSLMGKALSSYAISSKALSKKKWRGILFMACNTFSSVMPLPFNISVNFFRSPLCRYVSSNFLIYACKIKKCRKHLPTFLFFYLKEVITICPYNRKHRKGFKIYRGLLQFHFSNNLRNLIIQFFLRRIKTCSIFQRSFYTEVEFYLRLRTTWPCGDFASIFQYKLKHIAFR